MKAIVCSTILAGALALGTTGPLHAQGTGSTGSSPVQSAPSTARTGAQDMRMSESQIKSVLNARGYSDIKGMSRDGSSFKVDEAKRYGETVKNIRVDASSGAVQDEQRLSENQAKQLLRDRNYSEVSDVKRDGDTIRAKAKQGGQTYNLRIDARTGTVSQQSASSD